MSFALWKSLPIDWNTKSLGCGSLHGRPFICTADGLLLLHVCTDHGASMCTGHQEITYTEGQSYHSDTRSQLSENCSFNHFVPSCSLIHVPDLWATLCWCLHPYCFSYETCLVSPAMTSNVPMISYHLTF